MLKDEGKKYGELLQFHRHSLKNTKNVKYVPISFSKNYRSPSNKLIKLLNMLKFYPY